MLRSARLAEPDDTCARNCSRTSFGSSDTSLHGMLHHSLIRRLGLLLDFFPTCSGKHPAAPKAMSPGGLPGRGLGRHFGMWFSLAVHLHATFSFSSSHSNSSRFLSRPKKIPAARPRKVAGPVGRDIGLWGLPRVQARQWFQIKSRRNNCKSDFSISNCNVLLSKQNHFSKRLSISAQSFRSSSS